MPKKKQNSSAKKKKKTKRSEYPYPGIAPWLHPKTRADLIDHDYLDKLSHEQLEWLSKFNEEWLSGSFNHNRKDFHRTKKQKSDCYNRNNSRNRDIFALNKTHGWVGNDETPKKILEQTPTSPESQENALIDLLDGAIKKARDVSE